MDAIKAAEDELLMYGAIDPCGEITHIGRKMASFPLDPNLAKMLITSEKLGCADEILPIVASLSSPSIFSRPKRMVKLADVAKAKFLTNEGGLITMLNVYNKWKTYDRDGQWCLDNFIRGRILHEVESIPEQLCDTMNAQNMAIKSAGYERMKVLKSICSGMTRNVALRQTKGHEYSTLVKMEKVFIHRGISLFHVAPEWVVYQKVVQTHKPFMREVTLIDPLWLKEFVMPKAIPQNPSSFISSSF